MGWRNLRAGDRIMAIDKGMGLKKGQKQVELGVIEVVGAWPERLNVIDDAETVREGFPELEPAEFVAMFCKANGCKPDSEVMRIEFRYPGCDEL
jgi:hypothetical protein